MSLPSCIPPTSHGVVFTFFLLLSFVFFSHNALAQQKIVLNTGFTPPISNDSQTGFMDQLVAEAFKRIGYQLETVRLPAERALINANRGIDDGDLLRVAGLQKKYPNLIQVPEAVVTIDMVLFSKSHPSFVVDGWKSMSSQSLAIISGWKIMEKQFSKYADKVEIIKTDNAEQSFSLLDKGRADFMAYANWPGLVYLKAHGITDIKMLSPPLASPKFYIYLHKKHKKIVPKLALAIREMKRDGSINDLYNKILKPLL